VREFARTQWIAALQSSICAGHWASPDNRYPAETPAYWPVRRNGISLPAPSDLSPCIHPPPWMKTITGSLALAR
jgi:hypothetical protein